MNLSVNLEAAREVVGDKLSPVEWHTFLRLVVGCGESEIARERKVSKQAVWSCQSRILKRFGAANRMELIAWAALMGMIRTENLSTSTCERERIGA